MQKAVHKAKLIALSKPELIKVVEEVASEFGVNPNALRSKKASQEFLKQQDVEFKVHNPFRFGGFCITECDELSVIIPKKKNKVVGELMTSVRKKYERLNQIPSKLGISPSLPPPKQTPSLASSRKRKTLELEPEVRIDGLECNRSLPEGIIFLNNKKIETLEHGIFFTNALDEQVFEMASDIHMVEVETVLGYW
nr:hypothetical protein [Tanacetum cinerariifolium]